MTNPAPLTRRVWDTITYAAGIVAILWVCGVLLNWVYIVFFVR